MQKKSKITQWLETANPAAFSAYCVAAAFTTYFCMYAFRKPFSVGIFAGEVEIFGLVMGYKIFIIISQVLGYTCSKFLGIKIVSEMKGNRRALSLVGLILFAEISLVFVGIVPKPWGALFLFLNGLPLGMVWGLVFGFLEGRKTSEALGAGLSASYILASGVVKSVGREVMNNGVAETWMPFVTGLIFFPLFLIAVYLLNQIPKPTLLDEELRIKRRPMQGPDRWLFLKTYAPGLVPLTLLYMLLTAYRDFRDNFSREIWDAIGFEGKSAIYAASEVPVIVGVLIGLGSIMLIKNNRLAMRTIHLIMIAGSLLIGVATLGHQLNMISPVAWMILVGLGLYLGYVPYGCVLFDRLIAAVGFMGTAGFMIYCTDAFGYLGSVALMLYKTFASPNISWLKFFINVSYLTSAVCTGAFIISLIYFERVCKKTEN